jgi:hypothetical protein
MRFKEFRGRLAAYWWLVSRQCSPAAPEPPRRR